MPRLWLVTRGSQPAGLAAPLAVVQAPLWGLAKVVTLEHPELACTCVDLDPTDGTDAAAARLLAELISDDGEDRVAIRSEGRLVSRLVRRRTIEGELEQACLAGANRTN